MIYMAPVADFPSKDLKVLKRWASDPWQTNYERIPGLLALSNNFEMFGMRLLVKFCPNAYSPSRKEEKNEVQGYMLIHESGWPDETCGPYTIMGSYLSVDDCYVAVKEQGVLGFAYEHSGRWAGTCYAEQVEVNLELWEKWSENLTAPSAPTAAGNTLHTP